MRWRRWLSKPGQNCGTEAAAVTVVCGKSFATMSSGIEDTPLIRNSFKENMMRIISPLLIVFLLAGGAQSQERITRTVALHKEAFERQDLTVDGCPAFIIKPAKELAGPTPWVLYAPTLGRGLPGDAETWMFRQFMDAGIAIAGIDVGESYGSPRGRATYNVLHKQLTEQHGFAQKACLLARSRGGLMLYCWAVDNPEKVNCIAGIYPVCNIASYPGLNRACGAYGMTEPELAANLAAHNPIDRLSSLAKARVPIFHIHGNIDKVVPLDANSGLVAKRYEDLGGKMDLQIAEGQGHNMWKGFFECQPLVDFVIQHATSAKARGKESR